MAHGRMKEKEARVKFRQVLINIMAWLRYLSLNIPYTYLICLLVLSGYYSKYSHHLLHVLITYKSFVGNGY